MIYNERKTADEIKIKLKDIAKLQHLYIEIFTEEDEDYPDRRVISNKERAVQRILDKITDKRFNQIEIWKVIQLKSWDDTDNTFKPICNRLRELGYIIINNNYYTHYEYYKEYHYASSPSMFIDYINPI